MNGADELIYHFETSTTPPSLNELRRKEINVLKELKQNTVTLKKDILFIGAKERDERTYL